MRYGKSVGQLLFVMLVVPWCTVVTAGAVLDGVAGVPYSGEIWSGKAMPALTAFSLNRSGELSGTYAYAEPKEIVKGELFDCLRKGPEKRLVCKWKDRYGTGVLDVVFADDLSGFSGHWRADNSTMHAPWNGRRVSQTDNMKGNGRDSSTKEMQSTLEQSVNAMLPSMKRILEVSMQVQLDVLSKRDSADQIAAYSRNFYEALVKRGFGEDEALEIVKSVGVPSFSFQSQ